MAGPPMARSSKGKTYENVIFHLYFHRSPFLYFFLPVFSLFFPLRTDLASAILYETCVKNSLTYKFCKYRSHGPEEHPHMGHRRAITGQSKNGFSRPPPYQPQDHILGQFFPSLRAFGNLLPNNFSDVPKCGMQKSASW